MYLAQMGKLHEINNILQLVWPTRKYKNTNSEASLTINHSTTNSSNCKTWCTNRCKQFSKEDSEISNKCCLAELLSICCLNPVDQKKISRFEYQARDILLDCKTRQCHAGNWTLWTYVTLLYNYRLYKQLTFDPALTESLTATYFILANNVYSMILW